MMMAPEPGQQRGKLKLIDFGGAHHATEDVVRTIIRRMHIASVAYMSPEQRIERYYEHIDGRTDDWVVSEAKL
jgi:serine/threonine protein kinase